MAPMVDSEIWKITKEAVEDILKAKPERTELIFVKDSEASAVENIWDNLVSYFLKSFLQ